MSPNPDHRSLASSPLPPGAAAEKNRVALASVIAALLLTGAKVGVGLWTGSLGILAEALHSGLDLAAAVVTLWAVRWSSRPADQEHAYGHGKVENLSALFETALLLATCLWIIKEAVERLFFQAGVHVDANFWSFLVVILSIGVDFSRSRALLRVARKYDSQALEADALHFSTDIWSSLVVLLGLGGVQAAHLLDIPWLAKADTVAALGVAAVVVVVSLRLGKKAVADLLDTVPVNLTARIAGLARVEGVREARQVRVRRSGPEIFVDLVLVVERTESLEHGHKLACQAEAAIKREVPAADVVVHVEPADTSGEDILASARRIATAHGAAAHNLLVYEDAERLVLELHLEMDASLPLGEAHRRCAEIEAEIRGAHPCLVRVIPHIEPAGRQRSSSSASPEEAARLREALLRLPELTARGIVPQDIEIRCSGSDLSLSFRCSLPAATPVREAHDFTERIERALRQQIPNLGRVTVRTEPAE
jgi:cation diffusion facilitator family transporter